MDVGCGWRLEVKCLFLLLHQLLRGAPDSLLRSLHIQKDPTAFNYIKVGGQIKVIWAVKPRPLWETNSLFELLTHHSLQVCF